MFKGKSSLLSIHWIGVKKQSSTHLFIQYWEVFSYYNEKMQQKNENRVWRVLRLLSHLTSFLALNDPRILSTLKHVGKNSSVLAHRWEKAVLYQVWHSLSFLPFCRARIKDNGSSLYVLVDCSSWASCQRVLCCSLAPGFKHRNGRLSIVDVSKLKKE